MIGTIGEGLYELGVDGLVPERSRATGQAWAKGISFGLAPVAGALIGGLLYEFAGARTMFVVSSAVAAAAAGLAWAAAARARTRRAALVAP